MPPVSGPTRSRRSRSSVSGGHIQEEDVERDTGIRRGKECGAAHVTGGNSADGWGWGGVGTDLVGKGHAQEGGECAPDSRKESPCVWGPGGKQGSLQRALGLDPTEPHGSC